MPHDRHVTLFLCGDVMTGRGIDQVMARPCPPVLYESHVKSAEDYVALAEAANGPIPAPVDEAYVWGDALAVLDRMAPDLRIVNLETGVTRSEAAARKGINYRMSPENAGCLAAAGMDCCVLANNHVLDWGRAGLVETLETLHAAGIRTAGAGRTRAEAFAPAVLPVPGKGRVLVYGLGHPSSGIPTAWQAGEASPGIAVLPDLSARVADALRERIAGDRQDGDVVVASVHWGPNWGYEVTDAERGFARALVERAGVDVVHGHSSHHPRGGEVHDGRLILYGCGDFLNDYEGIGGPEEYRGDLVLMYVARLVAGGGRLAELEMVPLRIRKFRLNPAAPEEVDWLGRVLDREYRRFGAAVYPAEAGTGYRLSLPAAGANTSPRGGRRSAGP